MQWHTVVFNKGDQLVKDAEAQAFMHSFNKRYRELCGPTAGMLKGVEIHHKKDEYGHHIYHVSPMAASIGEQLLRAYSAVACAANPRLEEFEKMTPL